MEKDLLGEKAVPADAYYGVQTARALENFQISGVLTNHYPGYWEAWAIVKLAAARANTDVGAMKKEKLALIEKAVEAVRAGQVRRPVQDRLVPGRRRHLHQHERQRGAGQRRPRAGRPSQGQLQDRRAARRPEHVAVHQRLVPHRDQDRAHPAQREADRGAGAALRLLPGQGQPVPQDRQDGPHRAAGRGPHDGGPGVPRLRRRAGRRDPAPARRGEVPLHARTWAPPPSAPA